MATPTKRRGPYLLTGGLLTNRKSGERARARALGLRWRRAAILRHGDVTREMITRVESLMEDVLVGRLYLGDALAEMHKERIINLPRIGVKALPPTDPLMREFQTIWQRSVRPKVLTDEITVLKERLSKPGLGDMERKQVQLQIRDLALRKHNLTATFILLEMNRRPGPR
ncbi:hypothetical protein HYS54_00135 [Candidatus Micrarchaeota archaeon]|nr:hypothetical protein [Candidatus Micrarchaeota archaeon]